MERLRRDVAVKKQVEGGRMREKKDRRMRDRGKIDSLREGKSGEERKGRMDNKKGRKKVRNREERMEVKELGKGE